jgi:hypothetical protein
MLSFDGPDYGRKKGGRDARLTALPDEVQP